MGSTAVRTFPKLIAAYHVLHRLLPPRHPPNALRSLDRSHLQCPPVLDITITPRREAQRPCRTFGRIKHHNRKTRSHRTNPYSDGTWRPVQTPPHSNKLTEARMLKCSWDAPASYAGTQACSLYTMSRKPLHGAHKGAPVSGNSCSSNMDTSRMVEPVGIEPTT